MFLRESELKLSWDEVCSALEEYLNARYSNRVKIKFKDCEGARGGYGPDDGSLTVKIEPVVPSDTENVDDIKAA